MGRKLIQLGFCIVTLAMSAAEPATVTNSNKGVTNLVPAYTGTATLSSFTIAISSGNAVGVNHGSRS
ncbi:MAG: hypothetical protein WCC24_22660 [Terracidiphilus sp.]